MYREDFDIFFDAVQDEAVGLTLDTAHLVKSGITDIASLIHDFHGVINNVHMKDFADGGFRVLGHGNIDFAPIFRAIQKTRYDAWLCADEESGADTEAALVTCYRFITRGLSGSQV